MHKECRLLPSRPLSMDDAPPVPAKVAVPTWETSWGPHPAENLTWNGLTARGTMVQVGFVS